MDLTGLTALAGAAGWKATGDGAAAPNPSAMWRASNVAASAGR